MAEIKVMHTRVARGVEKTLQNNIQFKLNSYEHIWNTMGNVDKGVLWWYSQTKEVGDHY